jgi:hypothetical protein
MDPTYYREQAERCRRQAHDSIDPVLKISLRKLADQYAMRADEIDNDEIYLDRARQTGS